MPPGRATISRARSTTPRIRTMMRRVVFILVYNLQFRVYGLYFNGLMVSVFDYFGGQLFVEEGGVHGKQV